MQTTPLDKTNGRLYEQVAAHVAGLIEAGTVGPGERVPSVRQLRRQLAVSNATVMEAYRLLEDRGLISARPRAGYFVRGESRPEPAEPKPSRSTRKAHAVGVTSLAASLVTRVNEAEVIKLGAAVPDPALLPLAQLNRVIGRVSRGAGADAHGYAMPPGRVELRRQVAKRLMDAGCALSADDLMITNGATEAIQLMLRAVTEPGDAVAVESPTYYGFLEILESLHLKARELCTCPGEGVDLDELGAAMGDGGVKAVLISSNFANPLGALMPEQKKRGLVELAEMHELPVIEDDIYAELGFENDRPPSLKAFDRAGWVLTLGSLSKTLSPGLRVGWCAPGRFAEAMTRLKFATSAATATLPQLAAATFLAEGGYDRHLRRLRRQYREQTARLRDAVAASFPPATRMTRPRGGHVLWVEMPVRIDALKLAEQAGEQGISVAPGPLFSATGRYRNCLRLNCGLPWSDRVEWAVQTLGKLARAQLEGDAMQSTASDRSQSARRLL